MLEEALAFVMKNMSVRTIIDPTTGRRNDKSEYPVKAVRECILNALVHRDYSIHTEGMPIQVVLFKDRLEIASPGGLYGRIQINQLGKIQADTRNPVLANAIEILGLTENRYSGIPTIFREMKEHGLPEPQFSDDRGCFTVKLFNGIKVEIEQPDSFEQALLDFCRTPRSRREIADFLKISSVTYAIQRHVKPLIEKGWLAMSIPDKPGSSRQQYKTVRK